MDSMFEYATRTKLRFDYRGAASVEDLWDMNVKTLDGIYKKLKAQEKELSEDSLLEESSTENKKLTLEIAIVKYIAETKLAEKKQREEAADKREKKQQIMNIIARKQDEQLEGKSIDELQKMVDEL